MLIPALLLNIAVVAMFLTTVSFSGLMIWRESKHSQNTTTVRPTTKPTRPTISPPTRPPGPTPPPGPTTSPPFPTPPPHYKPWFPDPQVKIDPEKILNRTVRRALKPCNDFYFFACGEENESTPSMETDDNIVLTKTMIEKKYNDILGKPETAEDIAPLKLAKQLYNQCNEKKPGDSNEIQELISKFEALRNNLPDSKAVLKSFYETALDNGYLPKSLFVIDMVTKKESQRYVYIRKPSHEDNFYGWPLDTTSLRADKKELENALKKEKNAANYEKYIRPRWEEEEGQIAEAYKYIYEPQETTIQSLAMLVDNYPLVEIIRKTFSPSMIHDDQRVRVECVPCLRAALNSHIVTNNKESFLTYLIRHALADNLLDISEQALEGWIKERFGTTEPIERYKALFCSSKTVSLFKKAMDYAYIKNYVDPKKIDLINQIVEFSKTSMRYLVKKSGVEEPKKDKLYTIIETFKYYTPLHGDLSIEKDITDFYSGLQLDAASYRKSLEIVRKFVMDRAAKRFRLTDGFDIPIQAYKFMFGEQFMHYDRDVNSVYLSVNALQDMFLSTDRSAFLNFGGFGSNIGSALSQSVVSKLNKDAENKQLVKSVYLGIPMDATGNKDNFTECFVNSYKKHGYPTKNATDMLNEKKEKAIVYESDGVQVAYLAYKDFINKTGKRDQAFPSFVNYSDGAMFYISYANMARFRDPLIIKEEDYIRAYAKVNVMAKTSVNFDHEFLCEVRTIEKCNVWLKGSSKKAKLREHFDLFMR